MAVESIAKTLGVGSGIDITSLVSQLVDAQFANETANLKSQGDALTTQISSVSDLKNGITGFDSALKSLIAGGSLTTQPTSGNTSIFRASALSGASIPASLSSNIEVRSIAAAQSASTDPILDKTAPIGTGSLTLTFGTASVSGGAMTSFAAGAGTPITIPITSANSSLTGIAAAINAKNAGVTASILSDPSGARLVLKGATGASQAFTLTATEDAGAEGLSALDIGVGASGTSVNVTAQDAVVAVDGVAIHRAGNTILDLIQGVRLDLVSAAPGTLVNLGTTPPTAALSQSVNDFVDSYNQLFATLTKATDPATGPLRNDSAAKTLLHSLTTLSTKSLISGFAAGSPDSLSGIGVATNRDGTLRLDATRLSTALATYPGAIEAMFKNGAGLSAALSAIATAATNIKYGLGASAATYTKAQTTLAAEQDKATADAAATRARLTTQFSGMDAIVASYKSTQSFLTNQIAAWNATKN